MKMLISAFIAFFFTFTTHASVDLSGSIEPTVWRSVDLLSGYQILNFSIKIKNTGDIAYQGALAVKPFMIPIEETSKFSDIYDGAVLDTVSVQSSLEPGATQEVMVSSTLPLIHEANYLLAAFINSDAKIIESDTMNNVTDLVDVGTQYVSDAPANPGSFDLVSEISGPLYFSGGGAAHRLRTIVYGDKSQYPNKYNPSDKLWSRFLVADIAKKKIYTLPYNSVSVDKKWYAVSYHAETDQAGNPISVDYYSQAPSYENVPPGEYRLLTLLNTRDLLPEANLHNNLDVIPMKIEPVQVGVGDEIWIVTNPGAPSTQKFTMPIGKIYKTNLKWHAALSGSGAKNLALTNPDGEIKNENANSALLSFGLTSPSTLLPGYYPAQAKLSFDAFPEFTQEIPVRLFVNGINPPKMVLSEPSLVFEGAQKSPAASKVLKVSNSGTGVLYWKATGLPSWVEISPASGQLAPGQSTSVLVGVNGHGMGRDTWSGNILFFTNAANGNKKLSVEYRLD